MKLQHPPNGHRLKEELARAVARAEAAERDLAAAQARIAELEAQLAAQAWRPVTTVPPGVDVELLVHGYIGEDEYWYYRDETEPIQAWRPLPAPPID